MRKLPEGVRKEEMRSTESLSRSQKELNEKDSLDDSRFELDLLETGRLPRKTIEEVADKIEVSEDKTIQEKFDQLLIDAIDEALSSLGEPVKNAVYQHLQDDYGIEKKDILGQIDEFSTIIHKIFGLGASRLEIKFMKNLNSKIEGNTQMPEYEWPLSKWIIANLPFKEYVHNARIMHKKIVSLKMEKKPLI